MDLLYFAFKAREEKQAWFIAGQQVYLTTAALIPYMISRVINDMVSRRAFYRI